MAIKSADLVRCVLATSLLIFALTACDRTAGLESVPTAQLAKEYSRRFETALSNYEAFQQAISPISPAGDACQFMLKYRDQIQEHYDNLIPFAATSAKARGIAGNLNMYRGFTPDFACNGFNEIIAAARLGDIKSMSLVAVTLASPKISYNDKRLAYFWGREVLHRFPDDYSAKVPALIEEEVDKDTIAQWSKEWLTWSPETDTQTQPVKCGNANEGGRASESR